MSLISSDVQTLDLSHTSVLLSRVCVSVYIHLFCIFPTVLYNTLFGILYLYHRCVFPISLFSLWIKYCGVLLFLFVCLPSVVFVFVLLLVCILLMHFSTFCTFTISTFILFFYFLY